MITIILHRAEFSIVSFKLYFQRFYLCRQDLSFSYFFICNVEKRVCLGLYLWGTRASHGQPCLRPRTSLCPQEGTAALTQRTRWCCCQRWSRPQCCVTWAPGAPRDRSCTQSRPVGTLRCGTCRTLVTHWKHHINNVWWIEHYKIIPNNHIKNYFESMLMAGLHWSVVNSTVSTYLHKYCSILQLYLACVENPLRTTKYLTCFNIFLENRRNNRYHKNI